MPLAKVHSELAAAMGPEAFHAAACRRAEPVLQHRCHTWRFSRPRALGERSSRRPSAGQGPGRALGERSASASPLSECCESCLNAMCSRRELVQGPGSKKSSWEVSTLRALQKAANLCGHPQDMPPPPSHKMWWWPNGYYGGEHGECQQWQQQQLGPHQRYYIISCA